MIAVATEDTRPPIDPFQERVLGACLALMERGIHPKPGSVAVEMGYYMSRGLGDVIEWLEVNRYLEITTRPSRTRAHRRLQRRSAPRTFGPRSEPEPPRPDFRADIRKLKAIMRWARATSDNHAYVTRDNL